MPFMHLPRAQLPEAVEKKPTPTTSPPGSRTQFAREELLECAQGKLFGPGNAQLPLPPLLMVDRITSISRDGGKAGKGQIIAEFDIRPELWFFHCHFHRDPVMPGCLGLDAMWQLVGFFIAWLGGTGRGRALGVGEVKFSGQVTPDNRLVTYEIEITRRITRRLCLGVADTNMRVDGKVIYTAKDIRVGLFQSTEDF
ncbi:MAG: bifunctional 3-hydroxydecanoyl-ACP dehydratase/trans-2-decenoyl-ACP isomerase [Gammaproteobacteria bacterium]